MMNRMQGVPAQRVAPPNYFAIPEQTRVQPRAALLRRPRQAGSNLLLPHRVEHHFVSFSREGVEQWRAWGIREGIEVREIGPAEQECDP